jgi:hypothetical protein
LMPASPFIRKGCQLLISDYDKVTLRSKDGNPILSGHDIGGLYFYKCKTISNGSNPTKSIPSKELTNYGYFGLPVGQQTSVTSQDFSRRLLECHWAYGHLNFNKLRKLLGLKKSDDPECAACTIATARKTALSKHVYTRSSRPHHRYMMDIGFTRNNNFCFQLILDDNTRESHLCVLDDKSEAFSEWITLKTHLDNVHYPWKVAFIRTDNESVYTSTAWNDHCTELGIEHEFSARYRHDQNGVVERAMQAIGVPFRCMMLQGCAPESDIPDCLRHANVIRNNSPTKANNGRTPKEKALGMKLSPNKRLLKGPLFCLVFAHVYEEERAKHAARAIACVYLGYDDTTN